MKATFKIGIIAHIELTRDELNVLISALCDAIDWNKQFPANSLSLALEKNGKLTVAEIRGQLIDLAQAIDKEYPAPTLD